MSEKKKSSKERADKYEEKVKFDGTFEDMIGISVKDAEKRMEKKKGGTTFNIDDYVKMVNDRNNDTYVVVATKESNPKEVHLQEGFDYAIQKIADNSGVIKEAPYVSVFEGDIYR